MLNIKMCLCENTFFEISSCFGVISSSHALNSNKCSVLSVRTSISTVKVRIYEPFKPVHFTLRFLLDNDFRDFIQVKAIECQVTCKRITSEHQKYYFPWIHRQ